MSLKKRALFWLLVIPLIALYVMYQRSSLKEEAKNNILVACAGEQKCLQGVNNYFEMCYEKTADQKSWFRAPAVDGNALANCINENSEATQLEEVEEVDAVEEVEGDG